MRRKEDERIKAREMRTQGMSVNKIADALGVAKSSVFAWTGDLPRPRAFTAEGKKQKREERKRRIREARGQKAKEEGMVKGGDGRFRKARLISGDGRWMIQVPRGYKGKTYIGGRYVYEHRYLMEQKLGRLLRPGEVVHHRNGDRLDNRMENLEILEHRIHSRHHASEQRINTVLFRCPVCQSEFSRPRRQTFMVRRASKYKLCFCSRSCAGYFPRRLSESEIEEYRIANVIKQYKA
jgi:transposase-like protein